MAETSVTLAEETALRVRQLEVKFDAFETENKMSDCCFNELDEELEEGRVSLEKLEKRVSRRGVRSQVTKTTRVVYQSKWAYSGRMEGFITVKINSYKSINLYISFYIIKINDH